MQIYITISSADEPEQRRLVALDPSGFFLSLKEDPADIVLGELARMHPFASSARDALARLEELCKSGVAYPRAAVFPGAARMMPAPDGFKPSYMDEIHIDMVARTIAISLGRCLSFDDFCGAPPDRWESRQSRPKKEGEHIFAYRYHDPEAELHPTDLETASLLTGMYAEACPGPYDALSSDFVMLCGLLLGIKGDLFTDCVSGPRRSGVSSMREMRRIFRTEGHVVSDRAWMPSAMLRGESFADCEAAAIPDLVLLGRRLARIEQGVSPDLARQAIEDVIGRIGEDPDQFFLRKSYAPAPSNHGLLELRGLVSRICAAIGLDEQEIYKEAG